MAMVETPRGRRIPYSSWRRMSLREKAKYQPDAKKDKPQDQSEIMCDRCMVNDIEAKATGFCRQCTEYLCTKCIRLHNRFRGHHTILNGKDMPINIDNVGTQNGFIKPKVEEKMIQLRHAELVSEHNIRGPRDKERCKVYAAAVLWNGEIVIADGNNNLLKLFDAQFSCRSSLDFNSYPWDLCVSRMNAEELFATENNVEGVHRLTTTRGLELACTLKVPGICRGVTCWRSGIAVTVQMPKEWQLQLLDYKGQLQKTFRHDVIERLHFESPLYLTSIRHGRQIVISDYTSDKVTCIDVDNNIVVFRYKNDDLKRPRSMTTDKENNIYVVGNMSHNVHKISSHGRYIGTMMSVRDGLKHPDGIAYSRKDRTLVLQDRFHLDKMRVYRFKSDIVDHRYFQARSLTFIL